MRGTLNYQRPGPSATDVASLTSVRTTNTTPEALTPTDRTLLVDAASAVKTVTVPAAADNVGKIFTVKKIDSSVNTVTVDFNSIETSDGDLTEVLTTQYAHVTFQSDGSNWHVIASSAASIGEADSVEFMFVADDTGPSDITVGLFDGFICPSGSLKGIKADVLIPNGMDRSVNPTLHVHLFVQAVGAGADDLELELTVTAVSNDEQVDQAVDEVVDQTLAITNVLEDHQSTTFAISATKILAGTHHLALHVSRKASDAFTGDIALLVGGKLDFTR